MRPDVPVEERVEHCVTPACLERVHGSLEALWSRAPGVPDLDRMMFEIAVIEIAANVVGHSERHPAFDAHVVLRVVDGSLEAELMDNGAAVDVALDAALPDDALALHGRGIPLASRAVDQITYARADGVNRWRLVRGWQPSSST